MGSLSEELSGESEVNPLALRPLPPKGGRHTTFKYVFSPPLGEMP